MGDAFQPEEVQAKKIIVVAKKPVSKTSVDIKNSLKPTAIKKVIRAAIKAPTAEDMGPAFLLNLKTVLEEN